MYVDRDSAIVILTPEEWEAYTTKTTDFKYEDPMDIYVPRHDGKRWSDVYTFHEFVNMRSQTLADASGLTCAVFVEDDEEPRLLIDGHGIVEQTGGAA